MEPGGTLMLDGIVSQNVASYPAWLSRQSNVSSLSEISGFSLLPSVLFSVGSTVSWLWGYGVAEGGRVNPLCGLPFMLG